MTFQIFANRMGKSWYRRFHSNFLTRFGFHSVKDSRVPGEAVRGVRRSRQIIRISAGVASDQILRRNTGKRVLMFAIRALREVQRAEQKRIIETEFTRELLDKKLANDLITVYLTLSLKAKIKAKSGDSMNVE